MQRRNKTTHAAVTRLPALLLPHKDNDVSRLCHIPLHPRYDPELAVVERIILSVTPTPGVYAHNGYAEPTVDGSVQASTAT